MPIHFFAITLILLFSSSCSLHSWENQNRIVERNKPLLRDTEFRHIKEDPQIELGERRPLIDGIGWIVGIPQKIILWNHRVANHNVSIETEEKIEQHLAYYGLNDTKVRLNQYDPIGEWKRLKNNKEMHAGWRYTFGAFYTLGYTVFPGRIFGNDNYNPYTNTINIYSDVPSIGMVETAYAHDVRTREQPGLYATSQQFPILDIWHQNLATERTITFLEKYGSAVELKEGYHVLYPRYGYYFGNSIDSVTGLTGLDLGGALIGHVCGRYEGGKVDPEKVATLVPGSSNENSNTIKPGANPTSKVMQVTHQE